MRYLFEFMCVLALAGTGCSETTGMGGSGGTGGQDGQECESDVSDCTVTACVPLAELGVGGSGGMDTLGSGDTGGGEICENADACDDGEECTADSCADGTCEHVPVQDGTECFFEGVCVAGNCRALCDSAGAEGFCDNTPVADGTPCAGGICQSGACALSGTILPCTEQGIRNAIAAGGGPYTFACVGPTTVTTEAEIVIDNDVILDGEGNLTVDAGGERADSMDDHGVFEVAEGVTAELHRIAVTGAGFPPPQEGERGIVNLGTLTLSNSLVFGNLGGGIFNAGILTIRDVSFSNNGTTRSDGLDGGGIFNNGTLTVTNATISGNSAYGGGGGILNGGDGTASVVNSTISGNFASAEGGGISNEGTLTMTNCTLSGNISDEQKGSAVATVASRTTMLSSTLIDGDCQGPLTSNGYNIESPGNTCGLDQDGTDQINVTEAQLNLGELADNGGLTMTHALGAGSEAIDKIPEADCVDAEGAPLTTDQRGSPRPAGADSMCDVGAFEVQP